MAKKRETTGYIVLVPFKDAKEYGTESYEPGVDVSHFDADRLANLVNRKIVSAPVETKTEE